MIITRKGVPTEIAGTQPTVGEPIPAFSLPSNTGEIVSNETLSNTTTILSVYPDINTRVCDLQVRAFFEIAQDLPNVKIVNVSNNTLEDIQGWCATKGINALMLSDTDMEFGKAFGLVMPEFNVLARSIFVLDGNGILQYMEIVPDMAQEPNYKEAIQAATRL